MRFYKRILNVNEGYTKDNVAHHSDERNVVIDTRVVSRDSTRAVGPETDLQLFVSAPLKHVGRGAFPSCILLAYRSIVPLRLRDKLHLFLCTCNIFFSFLFV